MAIRVETKSIVTRFRHSAVLVVIGFLLFVNVAIGLSYLGHGTKLSEINEQIVKASRILANPLSSDTELQAQYREIQGSLHSLTEREAFDIILGLAKASGIDVIQDSGNLIIPSFAVRKEKIGGDIYEVLSFKGIQVRGDPDRIMALISSLDSGKTYKTVVLKRVFVTREVKGVAKEGAKIDTAATLDVDIYTKP